MHNTYNHIISHTVSKKPGPPGWYGIQRKQMKTKIYLTSLSYLDLHWCSSSCNFLLKTIKCRKTSVFIFRRKTRFLTIFTFLFSLIFRDYKFVLKLYLKSSALVIFGFYYVDWSLNVNPVSTRLKNCLIYHVRFNFLTPNLLRVIGGSSSWIYQ